jgi:hypothetical protein
MRDRFQPSNNHKKFRENPELEDEDYSIQEPDEAE